MTVLTVWQYQFKLLMRNKALVAGLIFVVAASLYAARYGAHFVEQQNRVLYSVDTLAAGKDRRTVEHLKKADTAKQEPWGGTYYQAGKAGYKSLSYRPTAFTALSIGQKDNVPFYHDNQWLSPNIYAVTTTDVQNPLKLQAGNFDLAFIYLYLFPLFIIALGYNVYTSEKEDGTLPMLRIQESIGKIVQAKLLFYFAMMIALSILINVLAFVLTGVLDTGDWSKMFSWQLIISTYILFWFALVYLVVSFALSGATTALVLGGLWVVLLLLVPSIVSRYVTSSHEKAQVQSIFNSRGDLFKASALDSMALDSAFQRLKLPFNMPAMLDTGKTANYYYRSVKQNELQEHFDNSLGHAMVDQQREEYDRAVALNWINPVYAVQNAMNQVSETEINNYLDYLNSVEHYFTKWRFHMYQYTLGGKEFKMADYERLPKYTYQPEQITCVKAFSLLLPILVLTGLFIFFAVGWNRIS